MLMIVHEDIGVNLNLKSVRYFIQSIRKCTIK